METQTQTILIMGGGIAGLCTAIALRQKGLEAQVYEQAETIRPVGAGLTLWPNAMNVLAQLGLAELVLQAGSVIGTATFKDDRGRTLTTTALHDLRAELGQPAVAIHRADLHHILQAALPPETIQLDHAFERLVQDEQGVTAYFANGQMARGAWLLGTDGIWSQVRGQMFATVRPRYAGYIAWRGVVEGVHDLVQGVTSEAWGQGQRFGIVPLNEHQVYWFATANEKEARSQSRQEAEEEKTQLLRRFHGWYEPVAALIEATPAAAILRNPVFDLKPFLPWSRGRVTLVGDAAHATTPNMGQGACQAMESAWVFAQTMGSDHEGAATLTAYEQLRQPRAAWITNTSWRIGQMGQWQNRLGCALRNRLVWLAPASAMKRQVVAAATFPYG